MKNSKLIKLLKTFSPGELHDFGKFVNSPFHNESPLMIKLYNALKKYYPAFEDKGFTKENIFSFIYGNAMFDDKRLRDRFSDMVRLAEEFLAIVNFRKEIVPYKRHMLTEIGERGLTVQFERKYKEIQDILDNTQIQDKAYFRDMYMHIRERIDFYENMPLLGKRKSIYDDTNLEVTYFLRFVMAEMLTYYTVMANWESNINHTFDYKFYEPVMKFAEENNFFNSPLLQSFYLILKIREDADDDNLYYELKKIYTDNFASFERRDKIFIVTVLYNDAQRRLMQGKNEFEGERFEIMKLQLAHDIYTEDDGALSREQYLNFVLVSVMAGDIKWAETFIRDYTDKVAPGKRKDAHLYVTAFLHYSKKEYDNALMRLLEIKAGDYVYHVRIKTLLTRIYFDLGDYEKVFSLIDSFKHYLTSNPLLPDYIIRRYANYTNMLYKLTMLENNKDEYRITKLVEEIESFSFDDLTTNKVWLLEKAVKLKSECK